VLPALLDQRRVAGLGTPVAFAPAERTPDDRETS
jgi:hypothetical protein